MSRPRSAGGHALVKALVGHGHLGNVPAHAGWFSVGEKGTHWIPQGTKSYTCLVSRLQTQENSTIIKRQDKPSDESNWISLYGWYFLIRFCRMSHLHIINWTFNKSAIVTQYTKAVYLPSFPQLLVVCCIYHLRRHIPWNQQVSVQSQYVVPNTWLLSAKATRSHPPTWASQTHRYRNPENHCRFSLDPSRDKAAGQWHHVGITHNVKARRE